MDLSPIKEDFLHYLWRLKKINTHDLVTTDGKLINIVHFGTYNTDSGPDFFNAKIGIDGTVWAGNIEMHVFSSDWVRHRHQHDKAYENVILHVVYEHDLKDHNSLVQNIPTIELKGKIPKSYLDTYLHLMQSSATIPCSNNIRYIDHQKIEFWKYALVIERLQSKSEHIHTIFDQCGQDWESTLYVILARYFGSKVNTEPFEMVAKSLPLSYIFKNKNNRETIDALVFGQAGMLMADYKDDYFMALKKEYQHQQAKYMLSPINPVAWKFSKMRPINFPTVRLAQFSALLYKVSYLFSQIKESESPAEIKAILTSKPHEYWDDHYRFGIESIHINKRISDDFIDLLIINAVAPVLYFYGKVNNEERFIEKSIQLLESVGSEVNNIVDEWKALGLKSKTGFDSQAMIQLKTKYCSNFKCLDCKIGHEIMNLDRN
jgi:hypothetical protein